ncbi:SPFH domain-containing protein [Argonema galeatum]|uniref:SPFH domain-containing protein n=1 Tax=Argonema galeatum TaxID=2942762 RepID=UPI002012E2F8|nr:stomatin-like protein [Argonema galeatum]MCL1465933.1 paraslipin [Argonema galeatum A003/A1]
METIIALVTLFIVGGAIGSTKIINQGDEALVERLGKYNRTMQPGMNLFFPFVETIVWQETTREQILDIPPQEAITKDSVSLKADAVVYWQLLDLKKAYYAIDDVEKAIASLVTTTLRSRIGQMELKETFSSRKEINQALLQELDEATESWGAKVTRVEIQDIKPSANVLESMEQEKVAAIKKEASKKEAEGTVEYIKRISEALQAYPNSKEVLQFLLAQKYVEANLKLGDSNNSKILFMDPKAMSGTLANLMNTSTETKNNSEK